MAYLNENYLKLQAGYLFPEISRRVQEFSKANPEAAKRLIYCGIGDVTEPLPRAAIDAMKHAADELGVRETFRGYGPYQGYEFLQSKIAQHDYRARGIEIAADEIFLSDGSKNDCASILDILGDQNRIAITDPVYPVYVDTNVMAGHTGPAQKDGRFEEIGGDQRKIHRHVDRGLGAEQDREPGGRKARERIGIAHGVSERTQHNESKQCDERKTQHDAKLLGRDREHEVGVAVRQYAFDRAFARATAEPSAAHE